MRTYEAVFIYPSGEAGVAAGKELVTQEFQNLNVKVLEEEDMHDRNLAYEVGGQERGHYWLYKIEAEPETITNLDRSLRIKQGILKYQFFKEDSRLRQKRPQAG